MVPYDPNITTHPNFICPSIKQAYRCQSNVLLYLKKKESKEKKKYKKLYKKKRWGGLEELYTPAETYLADHTTNNLRTKT